jgi:hypothetical protein
MKRLRKILIVLLILIGLSAFWYWADKKDYFNSDYRDLTASQKKIFEWQDGDDGEKLMQRYRQYFFDSQYAFPRQQIAKVKLFRNIPMISAFTSKTLKQEYVGSFINFCNDTTNFHWGETTWQLNESKYYCRLYNADGKVAGKIYFCLVDCGMTSSRPFSPAMKFGRLSTNGMNYIQQLFSDKTKWE